MNEIGTLKGDSSQLSHTTGSEEVEIENSLGHDVFVTEYGTELIFHNSSQIDDVASQSPSETFNCGKKTLKKSQDGDSVSALSSWASVCRKAVRAKPKTPIMQRICRKSLKNKTITVVCRTEDAPNDLDDTISILGDDYYDDHTRHRNIGVHAATSCVNSRPIDKRVIISWVESKRS